MISIYNGIEYTTSLKGKTENRQLTTKLAGKKLIFLKHIPGEQWAKNYQNEVGGINSVSVPNITPIFCCISTETSFFAGTDDALNLIKLMFCRKCCFPVQSLQTPSMTRENTFRLEKALHFVYLWTIFPLILLMMLLLM